MSSPFPGMDPFLEDVGICPDLHNSLAAGIRDALNQSLPRGYFARLEARPEIGFADGDGSDPRTVIPDITVLRPVTGPAAAGAGSPAAVAEHSGPTRSRSYEIDVRDDVFHHQYVEVREAKGGQKLVTLVEIVSPTNKRPGRDRRAYLKKQREVRAGDANTVEIDLLRAGRRLLTSRQLAEVIEGIEPPKDYLVLVSRYWRRLGGAAGFQLYPFGVRDPLPEVEIPLREHEIERVMMDLQAVFTRAYDSGPYRRGAVDYNAAPNPTLPADDAAWADKLLRRAGARGAA